MSPTGPHDPLPLDCLYLSFEGLLQPNGESQIVSYVSALARDGIRIGVVSFEAREDLANDDRREELEGRLSRVGVEWFPHVRHRRPAMASMLMDMIAATASAYAIARRRSTKLVHARSYVAGVTALAVKTLTRSRLLFDMRGFWPEDHVELGQIRPHGPTYRLSKRFERMLLEQADHVVVLTEKAKELLRDRDAGAHLADRRVRGRPITVIPCGVDLERFRPETKDSDGHEPVGASPGAGREIVLGHVGSGARSDRYLQYEMFRFAHHLRRLRPETRFLYLTHQRRESLLPEARAAGLADEHLIVRGVQPEELPRWIGRCRLGVFFLRPSFAAKGLSFAAVAEFLSSGVPVVANAGIGDLDAVLGSTRAGIVVPGLTDRELAGAARAALPWLTGESPDPELVARCRRAAETHYALSDGAKRYGSIYRALLGVPRHEEAVPVTELP